MRREQTLWRTGNKTYLTLRERKKFKTKITQNRMASNFNYGRRSAFSKRPSTAPFAVQKLFLNEPAQTSRWLSRKLTRAGE